MKRTESHKQMAALDELDWKRKCSDACVERGGKGFHLSQPSFLVFWG